MGNWRVDFPKIASVNATDVFLVQNAIDGVTYYAEKQNISTSSTNSEIDPIPSISGLSADWSANNVILDSNRLISQITDNSGNNRHATQTASGSRATWIDNFINNKPIIRLSGNQYYIHNNLTQPRTIIIVLLNKSNSSDPILLSARTNAAVANEAYYLKTNNNNTGNFIWQIAGVSPDVSTPRIFDSRTFVVWSTRWTTSTSEMFINNVLVDRKTVSGTALSIDSEGTIGAGYFNNNLGNFAVCDIHRIVMFDQAISYLDLFKSISFLRKQLEI